MDEDIIWMSGMIDGEGTIGVYQRKARVVVSNNERELLEPFKRRYGGSIRTVYKAGDSTKQGLTYRSNHYQWVLVESRRNRPSIERCLIEILPYLRSSKKIEKATSCLKSIGCSESRWKHLVSQSFKEEKPKRKLEEVFR